MIILDTNVISELVRQPVPSWMLNWFNQHAPDSIWTTSVTIFELQVGIALLKPGRRQDELEESITWFVREILRSRVVSLDIESAIAAGALSVRSGKLGRTIESRDAMIAGIVTANGATLATRNVKHFSGLGFPLINPWEFS